MVTRHFYKHRVTGVVAPLNDSFAAVFGDRFERVGADDADKTVEQDTVKVETPKAVKAPEPTPAPAAPAAAPVADTTADAPKEGDK